jgi:hypothetical protein
MSFLWNLIELILLTVVALDTLGYVVENRKNPEKSSLKDYTRLCFTWVFFLILRSMSCCGCSGYFGSLWGMAMLAGKVYVSIPLLGGSEKMYNMLIEENVAKKYFKVACDFIKSKTGCCQ